MNDPMSMARQSDPLANILIPKYLVTATLATQFKAKLAYDVLRLSGGYPR